MKFDGYKHADMPLDWDEERRELFKAEKPVPANPPSSGVSDAPGWTPGPWLRPRNIPWAICSADGDILFVVPGRNGLHPIAVVEANCDLATAAPDLYAALDDLTDITVCIDGPIGTDPQFFSDLRERTRRALAVMEKARGSVPQSQPTEAEPGTGSQEAD